jgi:beta-xylosidase
MLDALYLFCTSTTLHGMLKYILAAAFETLAWAQNHSSTNTSFTNPVLDAGGADPWVIRHDDYYYMTLSINDQITLLRSKLLTYVSIADYP